MRFWDSSALIGLVMHQDNSTEMMALWRQDPEIAVWWGTLVECASALARRERDGGDAAATAEAFARLDAFAQQWVEIEPHDEVREVAKRLLRVHPLRAADALQLAAAYLVSERRPPTLEIVTCDARLAAAASKEGFVVR